MSVQKLAEKHKGHATWLFSQSNFQVWKHFVGDKVVRAGICGGLSASWVKEHALGGALASRLGGANLGAVNVPELKNVIELAHDGTAQKGNSSRHYAAWLGQYGIVPVKENWIFRQGMDRGQRFLQGKNKDLKPMNHATQDTSIPDCAKDISLHGFRKLKNTYGILSFGGRHNLNKNAYHAVAAYINYDVADHKKRDAVFFDPNFGEFWFEDRERFHNFFVEFFNTHYNSGTVRMTKEWNLNVYSATKVLPKTNIAVRDRAHAFG